MQSVALDERLGKAAQMVPKCKVCADIGADHGFMSAWLLTQERVERMYICDISAPSLEKARRLFEGEAIASRAVFAVGDGLEKVPEPVDACVIAGMGGETIIGILERGMDVIKNAVLVLQPNVCAEEVRIWLCTHGFMITCEELIADGRCWYPIIQAQPASDAAKPCEAELVAGPALLRMRHPLLGAYAERQIAILAKAIASIAPDNPRAAELRHRRDIWEEILQWLKQR